MLSRGQLLRSAGARQPGPSVSSVVASPRTPLFFGTEFSVASLRVSSTRLLPPLARRSLASTSPFSPASASLASPRATKHRTTRPTRLGCLSPTQANAGACPPSTPPLFLRRFSSASHAPSAPQRRKGKRVASDEADETAVSLLSSLSRSSAATPSSGWLLDTGEIAPEAFASVKPVKDFPFLALSSRLKRLKARQQQLLRDWQLQAASAGGAAGAGSGESAESASPAGTDGEASCTFEDAVARQEEIQKKMKILETLAASASDHTPDQIGDTGRIAFLPHADAVNLLVLLAAEAESLGTGGGRNSATASEVGEETEATAASDVGRKAADEQSTQGEEGETETEGEARGASQTAQTDASEWRLKCESNKQKWKMCIARLKELALDHEDAFLVFYSMCVTNRLDAQLLPVLLERLEAGYFSSQALSKPLFHPLFEVWEPPCDSFAALVNVLPLSAKAVVVQAERRSERDRRESEGWLAPPESAPLVLPNWKTMHPVDMESWEKKQRRVVRTRYVKAEVIRQADGRKLAAALALHGRQTPASPLASPASADLAPAEGEERNSAAIWECRVLAKLLSTFLAVADYQPSLDFVLLLSDALRNSLCRTAVLPSTAVSPPSSAPPSSSASSALSPRSLQESDVLSLTDIAAVLDGFATSGYAVPSPLFSALLEHFLCDVDLFLASSPLSSAEAPERLSRSYFCSERGRATPRDCARLLHALAARGVSSREGDGSADAAAEGKKRGTLESLKTEAMTQAWCLAAPVLHDLQPYCTLTVLNSMMAAHSPAQVLSTTFFQRSLEKFVREHPDCDSSVIGTLFGVRKAVEQSE
ncbi:conserved hypothetical protein [Neospora caninum Liverpool]|uniref:Uncharacterized protein n=1 Tax=Neospora caninum (strain Liverpool) TaxID=572307 RepID=F0VMR6_NEOCL|nr:conserved hypothetical protein [Neospora caninum Liverpool]CBZ55012.1 conserved hypothetical protein [Neospora caninum Liverpool]|eukprot:XP_003885040.1 conserved hypothetical protein [Neospora caninum Liverpool]